MTSGGISLYVTSELMFTDFVQYHNQGCVLVGSVQAQANGIKTTFPFISEKSDC